MPFYKYKPLKQFGKRNTWYLKKFYREKLTEDAPPFHVPDTLIVSILSCLLLPYSSLCTHISRLQPAHSRLCLMTMGQ